MENKNITNSLCPDCPLELIQINMIDKCNNICGSKLTLYNSPQLLKFNKAHFIGKYLTYNIPFYLYNNKDMAYRVLINDCSIGNDIIIKNPLDKTNLTVKLLKIKNSCAYQLAILIEDNMIDDDCKVCLEICKFNIQIEDCKIKHNPYKFRYINDNCCYSEKNICCICKRRKQNNKCGSKWKWFINELC